MRSHATARDLEDKLDRTVREAAAAVAEARAEAERAESLAVESSARCERAEACVVSEARARSDAADAARRA
eukprot:363325-Chlamydomonas_euryale.AAC.9